MDDLDACADKPRQLFWSRNLVGISSIGIVSSGQAHFIAHNCQLAQDTATASSSTRDPPSFSDAFNGEDSQSPLDDTLRSSLIEERGPPPPFTFLASPRAEVSQAEVGEYSHAGPSPSSSSANAPFNDKEDKEAPVENVPKYEKKADLEPPPPYTEGSSPINSFVFCMSQATGAASVITQVQQGGPGVLSPSDLAFESENLTLDLR